LAPPALSGDSPAVCARPGVGFARPAVLRLLPPALPDEPLIFVEVALVEGLATARQPRADTAIFYSIPNCQNRLRGVPSCRLVIS